MKGTAQDWMLSQALAALARAESLHRRFFSISEARRGPSWEPPMDLFETESEIVAFVPMPGIDADKVDVSAEGGELRLSGLRRLPAELLHGAILRLELPQGRFEKRVSIPSGRYQVTREEVQGCLVVRLRKEGREEI